LARIGHRDRRRVSALRHLAFDLQGGLCGICGAAMNPPAPDGADTKRWKRLPAGLRPTFDHLVPRCLGGADDPGNLHLVCRACNLRRGTAPADPAWKTIRRRLDEAGIVLPPDLAAGPWILP
jgi:5-methylcytosine-specific restriction endonuclease McrA